MVAEPADGPVPRGVEPVAGAVAGLLAGLVVAVPQSAQGMMAPGLAGFTSDAVGLGLFLVLSALVGAAFGTVFGYRPRGYAATMGGGLVAGLLWWVLRSLTLQPLLTGGGPTWALDAATASFPFLIGDVLFGGLLGLGLHLLVGLFLRARPAAVPHGPPAEGPSTRIVILGGGFGGVAAAQELERRLAGATSVEVTLVSDSNALLFTPMLAEVASSSLEPQHISTPVRASLPGTVFRRAEVESVDTAARVVLARPSPAAPAEALPYDHLVLALGGVPNYRGLPGLAEHAFDLKTLEDATGLRNHVIGLLERADVEPDADERRRQVTFVVAGGGFAGSELIAELSDLVVGVVRYFPRLDPAELRFVLVHSQDRILPELGPQLAAYALDKLREKGIEFRLGTRVAALRADAVELDDGTEVGTRTLVWTAGNQPHPVMGTLPFPRSRSGAVSCDATMQVGGTTDVWAVGDCAAIPDPDGDEGVLYPPTAQHALRQGAAVARNIARALRGRPPQPFRFRTLGMLVVLGHQQAAAEIRGLRFSGLVAWLLWRGIYLAKLPGLEKKIRVLLDWTLDLFFPRDIVLTQVPRTPRSEPVLADRGERRA